MKIASLCTVSHFG